MYCVGSYYYILEEKLIKVREPGIIEYSSIGNLEKVRSVIDSVDNIDYELYEELSKGLFEAIKYHHTDLINYLVQKVRISEDHFKIACKTGDIKIVDLIYNGSKRNFGHSDLAYLRVAASVGNLEIVKHLFTLHQYIKEYIELILGYAAQSGNIEVVDFLLTEDVDINKYDTLYVACFKDDVNMIKYLINKGADIKKDYYECLHSAIRNNSEQVFKYLITYVKDKEKINDLLSLAVDEDKNNIVRILLNAGADPHHEENMYITKALSQGNIELANMLIEEKGLYESYPKKGFPNIIESDIEGIKLLYKAGADFKTSTKLYRSACIKGKYDIVKYLLELGVRYKSHPNGEGLENVLYRKLIKDPYIILYIANYKGSKNISKIIAIKDYLKDL